MAKSGLADRLYRGEANLNIVGRRRVWFIAAAVLVCTSRVPATQNAWRLRLRALTPNAGKAGWPLVDSTRVATVAQWRKEYGGDVEDVARQLRPAPALRRWPPLLRSLPPRRNAAPLARASTRP